jgi:hypothetical protein
MEALRIFYLGVLGLDVVAAIGSLWLAILLFKYTREAKKSNNIFGARIYFNFGMALLMVGLWISSILLCFFIPAVVESPTLLNFSFFFGFWIANYFVTFSLVFPAPGHKNTKSLIILYRILTVFLSVSVFVPGIYVRKGTLSSPFVFLDISPVGSSLFLSFFLASFIIFLVAIGKSYFSAGHAYRPLIKRIIFSVSLLALVNILFTTLTSFFVSFDTTPIAILPVFLLVVYVYLILFSKN